MASIDTVPTVADNSPIKATLPSQQPPKLDPEYAQWMSSFFDPSATPPPLGTIQEMRQTNDIMLRKIYAQFPPNPEVVKTSHTIRSYDGAAIDVIHFSPPRQTDTPDKGGLKQPGILHLHGGGHVGNYVDLFASPLAELAAISGVPIFSVEYRLAPEHPFPAAVEDGYAALKWLAANASSLGIDPLRIGIMGESSGGGLAAGIALLARDRGAEVRIKKMVLIYPMLDDRSIVSWPKTHTTALLTMCWKAYIGEEKAGREDAGVSQYAAPSRAEDLNSLPSTYMEVGGLDEFRDECASFAARLAAANNDIEFHLFPGVPHGFDVAREIGVTKRAMEGRIRAIRDV